MYNLVHPCTIIVYNLVQQYTIVLPMYSLVKHCTTACNLVQPCTALYNLVQPCTTVDNFVQQCKTLYNSVKPCTTVNNLVQQC